MIILKYHQAAKRFKKSNNINCQSNIGTLSVKIYKKDHISLVYIWCERRKYFYTR